MSPGFAALLLLALSTEDESKVHNREGVKHAKGGQYEQAIAEFKKAESLFQRYEHHCNIGRAYAELQRWPQAFLFLESCRLRWGPQVDPGVTQLSATALKALQRGPFAAIELISDGAVQVRISAFPADEEWNVGDRRTFWVPLGEHTMTVRRANGESWDQALPVAARDARSVTLAPPVVVEAPPPEKKVEVKVKAPEPVVIAPAPAPTPSGPIAPWITVGVGVAATAIGAVAWFTAKGISDRIDGKLDAGTAFDGQASDFRLWRGVAYGGLIGGPVLIAAGVLWRLLVPSGPPVSAWICADGAGLGWATTF